VEEQTIPVPVQKVEANRTLQPTYDSRKSDGSDGVLAITTSWWQDLLVFLLLVILLSRLLLYYLFLGCLLPTESVKPSIEGFVAADIHINMVLQLFNPLL
jgi:hypothetical protein